MAIHEEDYKKKERVNLKVNDRSNKMYLSSPEPLPGYHKHEYELKNGTKNHNYRKYVKWIDGKIFSITKDDYNNLVIRMSDGRKNYAISIGNYQNGSLSTSSQSFITVAKNADFSRHVYISFYPYTSTYEDANGSEREYTSTRCWFTYFDPETWQQITDERIEMIDLTSIPKVEKKMDKVKKKEVNDYSKRTEAFEELLLQMIDSIPEKNYIEDINDEEDLFKDESVDLPFADEDTKSVPREKKVKEDNPFND